MDKKQPKYPKWEPNPEDYARALTEVLDIYATTEESVSQDFYQGLCAMAKKEIDQLTEEIKSLNKVIALKKEGEVDG